jgi:GNAT superfamily N-acetyltransferase
MDEGFKFRTLKKEDCKEVARIRFEVQEMGFLPSMGIRFYTEILKGTCASKWGFGVVCTDSEERIAGFVCASIHLQKYYRDVILRRGVFLAFWAFLRVLRQSELLKGLLQYFGNPGRDPYSHVKAEWLTMVVGKDYRGKGLGRKLTLSVIDEYRRRGVEEFLSTVPSDNRISCSMHDKYGFELLGTFESHGIRLNVYRYSI